MKSLSLRSILLLLLLTLLLVPTGAQSLRQRTSSVILVKNMGDLLPLTLDRQEGLLLLTYGDGEVAPLREQLEWHGALASYRVRSSDTPERRSAIYRQLAGEGVLLVAITDGAMPVDEELEALIRERQSVLLFIDRPTPVAYQTSVIGADAIALVRDESEGAMRALGDAVMGGIDFAGTLLDTRATLFPNGSGLKTSKIRLATALPEDVDLDPAILSRIDAIAEEGVKAGAYPGCQVLVAKDGYIVYSKAFGYKDAKRREPNSIETLYDIASMTKATATVPLVMMADDEGKLRLQDRLDKHLDYLRWTNKSDVRLSQLLQHSGGMPAVIRFYEEMIDSSSYDPPLISYRQRAGYPTQIDRGAWARSGFSYKRSMVSRDSSELYPYRLAEGLYLSPRVREMMRQEMVECSRRRDGYRYSDIDFLLLQDVLEQVSGKGLDQLFAERLATPLRLRRLCYRPLRYFAPTEIAEGQRDDFLRRQTLRGDVDDEAAAMLGGVSGNAGLFGNAESCALIYQMLLDGGSYGGHTFIDPKTVKYYTTYRHRPSPYALGFDRQRGEGRGNTCEEASMSTYGHTGFTGTCFWIDPTHGVVYIFLSNRIAPTRWSRKLSTLKIRQRIQSVIYQAMK